MRAYVIRRLLLIIPTLFIVTVIIFFTVRLIPGDVIDQMIMEAGPESVGVTEEEQEANREALRQKLGLDMPIHIQYGRWMGGILQGDLGKSLWTGRPVTGDIIQRFPVSLELGLIALVVALLISLPVGVYSAIRQDTWGDYVGRSIAILAISLPSFWLGTMVMVFPSVWWNWSPPVQLIPFADNPVGNLQQFIIPGAILGMVLSGTTMRMTRTMMLEVLRQDYIRTAWSKGLTERVVVMRHAVKNALIPVVTIVGLQLPVMIGGSAILEQIFCLPGMGVFLIESLNTRDYLVVSGINLFMASFVVLIVLATDLTYGFLDPRVHYR